MADIKAKKQVIVIGGGWAGLSCATELSRLGYQITLLESAKQLGGRARRIEFDEQAVDNGQHVLIGAYRKTLDLFELLGIDLEKSLYRRSLNLHLLAPDKKYYNLKLPNLITPINLFVGLLQAKGFGLYDRWRVLLFGLKLFANALIIEDDYSVSELLTRQKQTTKSINALWEPICLASLNTPIEEASARIFVRVLHDTFCRSHKDADLIVPRVDLGKLIPDPAMDFIEQHGGNVYLSKRVTEIVVEQGHVTGVMCDKELYEADHVVIALPPHSCLPLAKSHPALDDVAYNLNSFNYNPIITVYLKYAQSVTLDRPVQALLGTTSQWIIDRKLTDRPGLMAVVISGPGEHMQLDNDQLKNKVQQELAGLFPHWPQPDSTLVIREKRATFSCNVGVNLLRPTNITKVNGLWLAGDYTNTGYPATLESAIISGQHTAALIEQSFPQQEV